MLEALTPGRGSSRPLAQLLSGLDLRSSSVHALALSGIFLLGAALRFTNLGLRPWIYDEAVIYWIAQGDAMSVIERNARYNSAPPLFALLVAAMSTINQSEAFLRSLPAVFGILTIGALYWSARAFVSPEWSLLAALLAAVAPTTVNISQYLREYSLAMGVAAILVGAAARYLTHRRIRDGLLTIAVSALALHVQYGLALLVGAIGLVWTGWAFVRMLHRESPVRTIWLLAVFGASVIASAWLVWLVALYAQFTAAGWGSNDYLKAYYWDGVPGSLPRFLFSRLTRLLSMPMHAYEGSLLVSLVSTVLVAAGLVIGLVSRAARPYTVIVLTAIGVTTVAALARSYPLGQIRQDLFLISPLYALVALVPLALNHQPIARYRAVSLGAGRVLIAGIVLVLLNRTVEIVTFRGWEDMRTVVAQLEQLRTPDDNVVIDPVALPQLAFYTARQQHPNDVLAGVLDDRVATRARLIAEAVQHPARRHLVISLSWSWPFEDVAQSLPSTHTAELVADENQAVLYRIDRRP